MANPETPLHTVEQPSEQSKEFNNDAIAKILLDVQEIYYQLRFQLVCKNWQGIINQAWFKKEHFNRYKQKQEPSLLLVVEEEQVSSVVLSEIPMVSDADFIRREIWLPRSLGSDGKFVGSCNGLLCIEVEGEISVFNNITREVLHLPKPTYINGYGSDVYAHMHIDFLFHSATGKYKVMLFYRPSSSTKLYSVHVYSLGANTSWRQVGQIRCCPSKAGVNVEDTVFWPNLSVDQAIISFDLSTEKIDVQFSNMQDVLLLGLTNWDGKLCTIGYEWERRQSRPSIKVWTLDNSSEHPWPGSLKFETPVKGVNGDVWLLSPYSIRRNRLSYATSEAIFFHDMSGNPDDVIRVAWPWSSEIKNCFDYIESLLPVPS